MSKQCIAALWISAENWNPGQWMPEDDCVDVLATLDDGSRWSATICSFEHVGTLRKKWQASGEYLSGPLSMGGKLDTLEQYHSN